MIPEGLFGESPGWVLAFLWTITNVDGQGVSHGLPWPHIPPQLQSPQEFQTQLSPWALAIILFVILKEVLEFPFNSS